MQTQTISLVLKRNVASDRHEAYICNCLAVHTHTHTYMGMIKGDMVHPEL